MQNSESQFLDLTYRSVADQRRRHALRYLRDVSAETAALEDLVDYAVQQETNSPAPDREAVQIDLYHVHLPLLDEAGAIDFDSRTETGRYRNHSTVETLLDSLPGHAAEGKTEG